MSDELKKLLATQPSFRLKQIRTALFDPSINSYAEITTLSKGLREKIKDMPWLVVKLKTIQESKIDDTKKALLELKDGEMIETVLMGREGRYTVCVSSQVGCSMACKFCATGQFGFRRNLTVEEIVDQVRFWMRHAFVCHSEQSEESPTKAWDPSATPQDDGRKKITNIVLMGQGEPFLNYENVKEAITIILDNTEIGPSKITVSTVGIPAMLDKMLEDKNFPAVRLAISLHSALDNERGKIIPSHAKDFISFLVDWAPRYHARFTSRALFLGLEYTMLAGVNDDDKHLKALIKLASKMGRVRINLIPYNCSPDCQSKSSVIPNEVEESLPRSLPSFTGSPRETIEAWHGKLLKTGFVCTIRRSQGQDIAAACGQLRNLN
ncbi:23S rRNA (adenine(2503)-C(2))-methyltransferase RlmN [Patescibacteria group bacterium]|nr:23S rRNA (adenine(2503)-C(2))-methyltransferase RlmN [Patescibacteria group bacterium]